VEGREEQGAGKGKNRRQTEKRGSEFGIMSERLKVGGREEDNVKSQVYSTLTLQRRSSSK
jgi:hypothetical protein